MRNAPSSIEHDVHKNLSRVIDAITVVVITVEVAVVETTRKSNKTPTTQTKYSKSFKWLRWNPNTNTNWSSDKKSNLMCEKTDTTIEHCLFCDNLYFSLCNVLNPTISYRCYNFCFVYKLASVISLVGRRFTVTL